MRTIPILLTSLLLIGCSQKTIQIQTGSLPKVEKAKKGANTPEALENILKELDERRAVMRKF